MSTTALLSWSVEPTRFLASHVPDRNLHHPTSHHPTLHRQCGQNKSPCHGASCKAGQELRRCACYAPEPHLSPDLGNCRRDDSNRPRPRPSTAAKTSPKL